MEQTPLNKVESYLADSSALIKSFMVFSIGVIFIALMHFLVSYSFIPSVLMLIVITAMVMWQHYCSQKQLQLFEQAMSDVESLQPTAFSGRLAGLREKLLHSAEDDNSGDKSATVDQLNLLSEQLGACMEIINESVAEEFEQIEQLATAMNEMTSTVKEVEVNAESASSSTSEATEVAKEGRNAVDATIASIDLLSKNIDASSEAVNTVEVKVESIGSVVDTIRSISDQTNLLALNAAIEAARAGEAGRGFAVVADEVRNLAKRTQDATVEIQAMIEQLQSSAQQAVDLMKNSVSEADVGVTQVTQAGVKLSEIVEKVAHISDMNYQIASAAKEQTTVADDINENLVQVKETVEGSVTVLKEVTEMTDEMFEHSNSLKES